jgi:hypothetical protein
MISSISDSGSNAGMTEVEGADWCALDVLGSAVLLGIRLAIIGVVGLREARRSTVGMISAMPDSEVEGPDRCVLDALSLTTLVANRGLDLGVAAPRSAGLGDKLELDAAFPAIGLVGLGGTIGEYDVLAATELL